MSLASLVDKVKRYANGVTGLDREDVLLVSYPKSGNTWVRFFLCNLVTGLEGDGSAVKFETVDAMMPELAVDDLHKPWPFKTIPRIVKSHNPYWLPFRGHVCIYVVRDPRDVMVSHYHFVTGKAKAKWEGEFSDFIRHPKFGLENWFRHVQSWQGHMSILVRYEDLLADDVTEFRKILSLLGATVPEDLFLETVEKSRFKNLKKVVEESGHTKNDEWKPGFNFMRKGESKDWLNWFQEADLALYEELKVKYGLGLYDETILLNPPSE